jgi:ubiquinone/menaquinone biosynthesis C-methylase UbiE
MPMKKTILAINISWLALAAVVIGQRTNALALQEIQQAEKDVPQLIGVLGLRPGLAVADIGAGSGAMVQVLATRLGPTSRIYATDIAMPQLEALRTTAAREHSNVTVVEGGERTTNLPDACCEAIYMRDVYHHFTMPSDINRSLFTALKAGGRLAVIDFEPAPGSKLPNGVPANRGGHGIRANILIEEVTVAGFTHDRTISRWPEPDGEYFLVLFGKP